MALDPTAQFAPISRKQFAANLKLGWQRQAALQATNPVGAAQVAAGLVASAAAPPPFLPEPESDAKTASSAPPIPPPPAPPLPESDTKKDTPPPAPPPTVTGGGTAAAVQGLALQGTPQHGMGSQTEEEPPMTFLESRSSLRSGLGQRLPPPVLGLLKANVY